MISTMSLIARVSAHSPVHSSRWCCSLLGLNQIKHVLTCLVGKPKLLVRLTSIQMKLYWLLQICSAYWFDEEAEEVREIAQRICPKIALVLIPSDLTTKGGDTEVVEFLSEQITSSPKLPSRSWGSLIDERRKETEISMHAFWIKM